MDAASLAQIVAEPGLLDRLSDDDLMNVLGALEKLRTRVWLRLIQRSDDCEKRGKDTAEPEQDQMLTVEEAAEILGVGPRWLYDRSGQLPFAWKLAPQTLRFSKRELYRWLETRG